jgi:hypothetical protein
MPSTEDDGEVVMVTSVTCCPQCETIQRLRDSPEIVAWILSPGSYVEWPASVGGPLAFQLKNASGRRIEVGVTWRFLPEEAA